MGLTNLVARATASADELTAEELKAGKELLVRKLRRNKPKYLAVLGLTAYRTAFGRPEAVIGSQPDTIHSTRLWVLPSPSGLNAHYQLDALGALFAELRSTLDA
jgi:TDG/mug DNA glycosylase family protein